MYSAYHPSALTVARFRLSVLSLAATLQPPPARRPPPRPHAARADPRSSADGLHERLSHLQVTITSIFDRACDRLDYPVLSASADLSCRVVNQLTRLSRLSGGAALDLERAALTSTVLPLWQFTGLYGIVRDADEDYSQGPHSFRAATEKSGQYSSRASDWTSEHQASIVHFGRIGDRNPQASIAHPGAIVRGGVVPPSHILMPRGTRTRRQDEAPALAPRTSRRCALRSHEGAEPAPASDAPDWFSDRQWRLIAHLLPSEPFRSRPGKPPVSSRLVLSAIFWKLSRRVCWDALPDRFPSPRTCRRYYRRWFLSGRLATIYKVLLRDLSARGRLHPFDFTRLGFFRLDARGRVRPTAACPDIWQTRTAWLFLQQSHSLIRRICRENKVPYFPGPTFHATLYRRYLVQVARRRAKTPLSKLAGFCQPIWRGARGEVCVASIGRRSTQHLPHPKMPLLDTPPLCQYKNSMKSIFRMLLGVGLQAILVSCTALGSRATQPSSVTSAPGAAPTFTAAPASTPTETPVPIVQVSSGDQALFNGDIDAAMLAYRSAADDTTDPAIRSAALWGLARAQYEDEHYTDSLTTLQQLLSEFPDSVYAAPARFLQGQNDSATQHWTEAADAYAGYLAGRPGYIDSYVGQLRGDALQQAGSYADAVSAYTAAAAAPHLDDAQALDIKLAQANDLAGNTQTALTMYQDIGTRTSNDYTRAQMDYLAGKAFLTLQETAAAYERFKHAVENYPLSTYAYQSLVELLNADITVSELDRGLVDYFAGVNDKALEALNRYIAADPNNDGTAYYYRALTYEALQNYPKAVDELTYFIDHYSSHARWDDAWDEKSSIQWINLDEYPNAAQTMLDFVKAAPASDHAADALMTAARIYERDGRFDQAATVWRRVADEYPLNPQASMAVMFAGLMQYRQSDYRAALPLFEQSLVVAKAPEDQARAYLWVGKTQQKLGSPIDTQNAWQLAQAADPAGYYGERANDLLTGHTPFAASANSNLDIDLAAERRAADSWVRLTFKLPSDTDLSGLDTLATDSRLIRGRELWNLGLLDEARLEFEDLRSSVSSDPVLTYRLGNYLLELGLYRSGITAIRQVLTLAGLTDQASSMLAPPWFSHVRYGLYYKDLIVAAAQKNGFDPLLLFSVIRQESLFEGFVSSTAGARGLMQIVPSTGAGISRAMGWPIEFTPDLLYRPDVSITLGSYYLASNRASLGGDIYAALAAYNGGPSNAILWRQLAPEDPDLFLESVRAQETRDYIRSIYEIYAIYSRLYGPGS